jgi:HlyD family secretion protein
MNMLRRIAGIAILMAVLTAAAWALWPRPVAVETAILAPQTLKVVVEDEGKSRIRDVFTVSAPIPGQMMRVDLMSGDAVEADKTIVATLRPVTPTLLDSRALRIAEAAVAAAQAGVDLSLAQLRQAEAQLSFMRSEMQRAETLAERGTISPRSLEKARLDVDTAQAAVESARAAQMVRRRELESAEAALSQGLRPQGDGQCCVEVRAPVSGRVLRVLTESEQVVPAGTPLVEIGDPDDLEIVADILSRDAVRIAPGAGAEILGWGGDPRPAHVVRIDPSAETKVSALGIEEQRVNVVLGLDGPHQAWERLGHGFRVVVRIDLWQGEDILAVPIAALFRQGDRWAVFVAEGGRARLRPIAIGERNDSFAEVREGLAAGDAVILHPSDRIEEGVAIVAARP